MTLSYDGNGKNVSNLPESATAKYSSSFVISSTIPEREGCFFTGWCDDKDGYGDYYCANDKIQLTKSVTLYAQWEESAIEDETYGFDMDAMDLVEEEPEELDMYTAGVTYVSMGNNGYTRDNWKKWSQKDHVKERFRKAGCWVTTQAMLINHVSEYYNNATYKLENPERLLNYGIEKGAWFSTWETGNFDQQKDPLKPFFEDINYNYSKETGNKYTDSELLNLLREQDTFAIGVNTSGHIFLVAKDLSIANNEVYLYELTNMNLLYNNGNVRSYDDRPEGVKFSDFKKQTGKKDGKTYSMNVVSSFWIYHISPKCSYDHNKGNGSDSKDAVGSIKDETWNEGKGTCNGCNVEAPVYHVKDQYDSYTVKSDCVARKYPYSKAEGVTTLKKGDEVVVTGTVKNLWQKKSEYWANDYKGNLNHTWLKVEVKVDGATRTAYVYDGNLKFKKTLPEPAGTIQESERLKMSKDSVNLGSPLGLRGQITSTNCTIDSVKVNFIKCSNNAVLTESGMHYEASSLNTTSLSMTGKIDNSMLVNKIKEPGKYKYRVVVTAKTKSNKTVTKTIDSTEFEVKGKSTPAVTVNQPYFGETPYVGGKKVTIYSNNSGGTLYYSSDNWLTTQNTTASSTSQIDVKNDGTVIRAYYLKSGVRSDASYTVSLKATQTPYILSQQNANNCMVSISGQAGSTIYYKIDSAAYKQYLGPFSVTKGCKITAYSEASGYTKSTESSENITLTVPSTPKLVSNTQKDIAMGRPVSISWNKDAKAGAYSIIIKKDGTEWKKDSVDSNQYAFNAEAEGEYSVSIYASNFVGDSDYSNEIKVTAHKPSEVRFEDYDGKIISSQTVDYGESAVRPASPSRRGYTFNGWNGGYTNVIKDTVVVAEYEINVYSIRFYDIDGETFLGSQSITYNEGINAGEFSGKVTLTNAGRAFTDWAIFYAKEEDSNMDITHVDSDMKVKAVTTWTNDALPVLVDNLGVTIAYGQTSEVFAGYKVSANISTTDRQDIRAKIIVTLLNDAGNGTYKMINAKVDTAHFTSDTNNLAYETFIACDGSSKADRVEISVVSIEGSDRTGGLIAETKNCDISLEASKFWSKWLTAEELAAAGHSTDEANIESKNQYRFRENTKSTKQTTSSTPPAGYTYLSNDSYWADDWSGWSDSVAYSSSTREVQTKTVNVSGGYTEYRYGCWINGNAWQDHYCKTCGESYYKNHTSGDGKYLSGSYYTRYTDWSTNRLSTSGLRHATCTASGHNRVGTSFYNYKINNKNYWWEESRYIDTSYNKTQYRYRDIHPLYTHYMWVDGSWSNWSDTVVTDGDLNDRSFEVEQRVVYRYVIYDSSNLSADTEGAVYNVSGSMNNAALNGKKASILVFKSNNTDPTESQLEYVSQTTLGANGEYAFSFITKEEPSFGTLDFNVALAIEGSDNLITVDRIRYDRESFKVIFEADSVISEQNIYYGESAEIPEAPEKTGYDFIGWSRNTTNVTKDIVAYAKYKAKTYSIAFVDYNNSTCIIRKADYDTKVVCPDAPECEGYDFDGWDVTEDQLVTGDMVVTAKWTAKKYTITFVDHNGNKIDEQEVEYGQSAVLPDYTFNETGYNFVAWSNDNNWWKVSESITVHPVVVSDKVLGTPYSYIQTDEKDDQEGIVLTADEGAVIYYTVDGSDPITGEIQREVIEGEETECGNIIEYTEPIVLEESTYLRAFARKEGYEDSEIYDFWYVPPYERTASEEEEYSEIIPISTKSADVNNGDQVLLTFGINKDVKLKSMELRVELDPAVFCPSISNEQTAVFYGALTRDSDELYVRPYEDGNGISIFWRGEYATSGTGEMFSVLFDAYPELEGGSYPISVSYVTSETYDKAGYNVPLDDIMEVKLSKNDVEFVGESGITVNNIVDQEYTGSAIMPKVTVKDNGVILTERVDYTLTYKNNVKVGDASDENGPIVIIKGKGNYEDEIPVSFTIKEKEISSLDVTDNGPFAYKYNGRAQKVALKLTYNKKVLRLNKDYQITYLDANKEVIDASQLSAVGRYYLRIEGIDNFTGTREIEVNISAYDPLSKAVIAKINNQDYTGKPVKPLLTVTLAGKPLTLGTDYLAYYTNNIEVGTATVKIKGIGDYAGEKTVTFKINGNSIANMKVEGLSEKTFDGRYFKPTIVVYKNAYTTLREGTDYDVIYSNNRNAGQAKVEIIGKGAYTGKIVKTFKIKPTDFKSTADFKIQLFDRGEQLDLYDPVANYIKGGVCPTVSVIERDNEYNKTPLRQNVDYTVKYKLNTAVTLGTTKKASMTLIGKGNYKGSITVYFDIAPQDISNLTMAAQDVVFNGKANRFKTTFTIKDLNGKTLTAGTDYYTNCTYKYAKKTVLADGSVKEMGAAVEKSDVIPVGAQLSVTVEGKGNYKDSEITATYNVVEASLAKAKITCKNKEYTGRQVTIDPNAGEIKVVLNGKNLIPGVDYEIDSYSNNISKGKAKLTIKGIGNYGGFKEGTFNIGTRNIFWWIL